MINSLYRQFRHWSEKGSVYIISDTHFNDPDCKLIDPNWITPDEQVVRINSVVKRNDTLIHLGDVGNPGYMLQVNGYKVLICGNHDRGALSYEPYFHEIYEGPLWIAKKILLSHEPLCVEPEKFTGPVVSFPVVMNLHGHCHGQPFDRYAEYRNFCADVIGYTPVSLGKLIKNGLLSEITDIHRATIDHAAGQKNNS